jgi:hypothetical protein
MARPGRVQSEQDLTHRRAGPLGDMAVVPDGYVGPMPFGAVTESDYRRMVAVYGNIESGSSSLRFDTSNFLKDGNGDDLSLLDNPLEYVNALVAAQEFRAQYMGYIQDLVPRRGRVGEHDPRADGGAAAADVWRRLAWSAGPLGATEGR